jgi:hypothetical protein
MRPSKENKPNKGFKGAFRAGMIIVIFLSLIISWITVIILRSLDNSKREEKVNEEIVIRDQKDTVFVEKVKEIKVTDTFYKYLPVPKPKIEERVAPKRDTVSK